jgi:hypothetical protein
LREAHFAGQPHDGAFERLLEQPPALKTPHDPVTNAAKRRPI